MQTYAELKEQVKRVDGHELSREEYQMIAGLSSAFEARKGERMDANESLALVRALTMFLQQVYEVKLTADLKYDVALPMLQQRPGAGVKQLGWYVREDIGTLDFLANGTTNLKTLSMDLNEKLVDIKIAGARIAWTWEDIDAAIYQGRSLPTELGMVARRATDRTHDEITAKGNAAYKVNGLMSEQSTMTSYGSLNWSGLNSDQKVQAVLDVARRVSTASGNVYSAGAIGMAPAYFRELETLPYGDNKDKTALDFLENVFRRRNLFMYEWYQFTNVTLETLNAKDVIMAYPFSPEAGENMIVEPFMMKPPKEDINYNVSAGVFMKTAGVVKRQPKAFVYGTFN